MNLGFIKYTIPLLLAFIMCSCTASNDSGNDSVVMVKNEQTASYGTGFAVGSKGERSGYIVTAYSVIAAPAGATAQGAVIRGRASEGDIKANIVYSDIEHDIAVLQIADGAEGFEAGILAESGTTSCTVYGYGGTGNITSNFEEFTSSDINKYNGEITDKSQKQNGDTVYLFSGEFNKAANGAPAVGDSGIIGMCAFASGNENFSQYIIPSEYICTALDTAGVKYMTAKEVLNKRIMCCAAAASVLIALLSAAWVAFEYNKSKKNKEKQQYFLRITSGALAERVYIIDGECTVGRDPGCTVVYPLNEPGIGRLHCTIKAENNRCVITDNNSRYGVFFESGERLKPNIEYTIDDGGKFYLAGRINTFEVFRGGDDSK